MAKGAGCTPEFRAKAVGLLTESRGSCSSEARAVDQVAGDPGVAPETLRRWRDKTGAAVAAETRQSAGDAMAELKGSRAEAARLGRANGILRRRRLYNPGRRAPSHNYGARQDIGCQPAEYASALPRIADQGTWNRGACARPPCRARRTAWPHPPVSSDS